MTHGPNWHDTHVAGLTLGERIADKVATGMGSWRFIIIQSLIVLAWMAANVLGFAFAWDVYPFILLNLMFSTQAAYAAPIIMMAQNRSAERDRAQASSDHEAIGLLVGINQRQTKLLEALHTRLGIDTEEGRP